MTELKYVLIKHAEDWAHHAYLRTCAEMLHTAYGTVEDALIWCMFYLWASENLEEL